MGNDPIALAAFDLDGTLLRGDTVCEVFARNLGRLDRMMEFEGLSDLKDIRAARQEMRDWYSATTLATLCSYLPSMRIAPRTDEGLDLLRASGCKIAIVSITWEFAVAWFARRFNVDYYVGTRLSAEGEIAHFWPHDKPRWVSKLADQLELGRHEVAAIGDSPGDVDMLRAVGYPYYVGRSKPDSLKEAFHYPDGDILRIAQHITGAGRQ